MVPRLLRVGRDGDWGEKAGLVGSRNTELCGAIRNVRRISNESRTGRGVGIQAINDKVSDLGRMTTGISLVWRVGT
jgi:hypothetical protein